MVLTPDVLQRLPGDRVVLQHQHPWLASGTGLVGHRLRPCLQLRDELFGTIGSTPNTAPSLRR